MEELKRTLGFFDQQLLSLMLTMPRLYAFFSASQLLGPTAVPRLARTGLIW